MITSNIAFYPCISLDETGKFYTEIIGLKTVYKHGTSIVFSTNQGHFGFVQYDEGVAATGRLCLSLNVTSNEDVDTEYNRVVAVGGKPNGAPAKHKVFPVYSFFINDPNGYFVEFQKLENVDI